jgi:RNA polymerase sigma-70 factor (ECF subfamily)
MLFRLPSDEDLMTAVSRGDLGAFEQLVLRHQHSAWTVACRFLGDPVEAEDIAQEAFLRILDAAPRYQPTASFRTYLHRVLTRLCLDHTRKKRPRYGVLIPDEGDGRPLPEEVLATRERDAAVAQALNNLSPRQRLVLIWRYYEGLNYMDIAAALETSPKGIERLLARARTALEKELRHLL